MLIVEGGCLCGAVRYRVSGTKVDAGFCHCRLCQRSSGAPVLLWVTLSADAFQYIKGEASGYQSSTAGRREFCGTCGTQLTFRSKNSVGMVDVTVCSLDHPEAVTPDYHIWTASQLPSVCLADGLPTYRDAGPDAEG
jgi:hypothetical protein